MQIIFKQQRFRVLLSIFLMFCQFQPGIADKGVAYKKKPAQFRCRITLERSTLQIL